MTQALQGAPFTRERLLVIRADAKGGGRLRALEERYPELEFVYCESFLSGIVEASRGGVRAMLARIDGGPRRLAEAVGALGEAGGDEAKIVLCCAPEHEPQAQAAMAGGADDYVIEPLQAEEIDRAIGYGRVETMPGFAPPPSASMDELGMLGDVLALIDAPPQEMLQKAADLIREALQARGAFVVVEGSMATSGEPVERPVLLAALKQGERAMGQVGVSERDQGNVKTSQRQNVETTTSDEATKRRSDGGKENVKTPRRQNIKASTGEQAASGTQAGGGARRGGRKIEIGEAYTLGDAQKLEHYAGVLSHVLAAAARQRQLQRLAVTDEASGLPNRRYLREQLARIMERAADERFSVTVLLFDVDDFKRYNDRFGHDAGDEILRVTGELFRKHCREQDIVARYGGDEFAVVFYDPHGPREPGSKPPAESLFVLDRFKDSLRRHKFENVKTEGDEATERRSDEGPRITISGGLATYPWDAGTVDALLTAADQALLSAKRAGKNRIFVVGQ